MCHTFKVFKSGYYAWLDRRSSRLTAETTRNFPTLRKAFRMCRQSHDHCRPPCWNRIPACKPATGCPSYAVAWIALPDLPQVRHDNLEAYRSCCSQPAQSKIHGISPQHRLGHIYQLSQDRTEMALSHGFHRPVLALERFARKTFGHQDFSQGSCGKEAATRPSGPQRQGNSVRQLRFTS